MNRTIYRKVTGFYTTENYISVNLECGHELHDEVKNKWNVGDKISCDRCLKDLEKLEKLVINTYILEP